MTAPWSEREDISKQVEDANEAARGEAYAAAEVDAYDERPTRAELERDEYWLGRERDEEWWA